MHTGVCLFHNHSVLEVASCPPAIKLCPSLLHEKAWTAWTHWTSPIVVAAWGDCPGFLPLDRLDMSMDLLWEGPPAREPAYLCLDALAPAWPVKPPRLSPWYPPGRCPGPSPGPRP